MYLRYKVERHCWHYLNGLQSMNVYKDSKIQRTKILLQFPNQVKIRNPDWRGRACVVKCGVRKPEGHTSQLLQQCSTTLVPRVQPSQRARLKQQKSALRQEAYLHNTTNYKFIYTNNFKFNFGEPK